MVLIKRKSSCDGHEVERQTRNWLDRLFTPYSSSLHGASCDVCTSRDEHYSRQDVQDEDGDHLLVFRFKHVRSK